MRIVVVGCGSIGKRHLRNLKKLKAGELVGVETDVARREAVQKEFGISVYGTCDQVIHGGDVVFVTVPTALHVPVALEAARAGCHLFVEKPLSHTFSEVPELIDVMRQHGRVGFVGSNWKFHHSFCTIKELLEKHSIGRVTSARCQFGQYLPDWHPWEDYRKGYSARRDLGGGILLDSHEFDLMTWLLGSAASVCCMMGRLSSLEIETEDTVAAIVRFRSGAIGEIHLDYTQRAYQRTVQLYGEEGTIRWDIHEKAVHLYRASHKDWQIFAEPAGYTLNDMYVEEVRHFLQCVEGRQAPLTTFDVGASVLQLQLAAQRSSAERREVLL